MTPRTTVMGVLMVAGLLAYLYYPAVTDLVTQWSLDVSNFGYGIFIPPVAAYLVWDRRRELRRAAGGGSWWGYPLVLAGVGMLILGRAGGVHILAWASLIVVLFGLALFLGGVRLTGLLAFPLLFLALMIPPPPALYLGLTWPLQMFTARFTTEVLRLVGYPVLLHGVYIDLPKVRLEVAAACSGFRSLVVLAATGVLLAFLAQSRPSARAILIASVVPIGILANSIRVAGNVILGIHDGTYHTIAGWVVFVMSTACLLTVSALLEGRGVRPAQP